jgi:hypothetical protein
VTFFSAFKLKIPKALFRCSHLSIQWRDKRNMQTHGRGGRRISREKKNSRRNFKMEGFDGSCKVHICTEYISYVHAF